MYALRVIFLLLLLQSHRFVEAYKTSILVAIPRNLQCTTHNHTLIKQTRCLLDTAQLPYPLISAYWTFGSEILSATAHFTGHLKIAGGKKKVLDFEFNCCAVMSEIRTHFVLAFVLKEVLRNSNLPLGCPLKKNFEFYVKDFNGSKINFPSYAPAWDWFLDIELKLNDIMAYTFSANGNIIKVVVEK